MHRPKSFLYILSGVDNTCVTRGTQWDSHTGINYAFDNISGLKATIDGPRWIGLWTTCIPSTRCSSDIGMGAVGTGSLNLGPDLIKSCRLTNIGNPIVEIRRSLDRLIPTMGFTILVRCDLYIESGPRYMSVFYIPICPGSRYTNDLQRLENMVGYQDSNPSNGFLASCHINNNFMIEDQKFS